jgi:hypothetical protein
LNIATVVATTLRMRVTTTARQTASLAAHTPFYDGLDQFQPLFLEFSHAPHAARSHCWKLTGVGRDVCCDPQTMSAIVTMRERGIPQTQFDEHALQPAMFHGNHATTTQGI